MIDKANIHICILVVTYKPQEWRQSLQFYSVQCAKYT